ncbi:MAG: redoxin domain-containing protein [Clostridia bacterium]|nr:redoxin domain-containing protein [Clostridia bacterium]
MKMKRVVSLLLAMLLICGIVFQLVSCGDNGGNGDGGNSGEPPAGTPTTYTFEVKSIGGMPLKDVLVELYDSEGNLAARGQRTNSTGIASISCNAGTYTAKLSNVPDGYIVNEAGYEASANGTPIVLTSQVISDMDLSGVEYKVGDIMHDFELTTITGEKWKLSEVLKEKKAAVLNFWYTTCTYCIGEFPHMENAYNEYKDKLGLIAINGNSQEDVFAVESFVDEFKDRYYTYYPVADASEMEDLKLSFPFAKDSQSNPVEEAFASLYGDSWGNPVTVMIDRYGVITMIYLGAIPTERHFNTIFDYYTSDNYKQMLIENEEDLANLVPTEKPDIELDENHYEQLKDVLVKEESQKDKFTFEAETGSDAEYAWPFIIIDREGEQVVTTSNTGKDSSYSILHAKVELKAGEAIKFEYFASMQTLYDTFYVLVDEEDIYTISSRNTEWVGCCPWVASEDGVYDVVLLYLKDLSGEGGEDAVHLRGFEIVNVEDLDVEAYIPRDAATKPNATNSDFTSYATVVLGSDGYYHVGTADGPILMASLLNYSNLSNSFSVSEKLYETYEEATDAGVFMVNGVNEFDTFIQYCNYASNAKIYGYCSVTEELKGLLDEFAKQYGFGDYHENKWLQLCSYYEVYGKDSEGNPAPQLGDIISGLASFSAPVIDFTPVIDETNPENSVLVSEDYYFSYDRVIMPRGYFYAFTPTVSGVYRFTSNSTQEVVGWIFTGNHDQWIELGDRVLYLNGDQGERYCTELLVQKPDGSQERDYTNVSMVAELEAGTTYYIDIAFYDVYATGSFSFNVKFLGHSFAHFKAASPGFFTYEETADGSVGDYIVGGIDVELCTDESDERYGYYCHKLPDGSLGSIVYADFHFGTNMFPSNSLKTMIGLGAFDFSKTETDNEGLTILANNTLDELKEKWGDDYGYWYEFYQFDDLQNGIYHGRGEDMTEAARAYIDKMISNAEHPELQGCVAVDEELAELLQMLIDKFSFQVEGSWTKVCYYYDYLGE